MGYVLVRCCELLDYKKCMLYCPEEDCRKRTESGRNSLGRAAPAGEVTVCKESCRRKRHAGQLLQENGAADVSEHGECETASGLTIPKGSTFFRRRSSLLRWWVEGKRGFADPCPPVKTIGR